MKNITHHNDKNSGKKDRKSGLLQFLACLGLGRKSGKNKKQPSPQKEYSDVEPYTEYEEEEFKIRLLQWASCLNKLNQLMMELKNEVKLENENNHETNKEEATKKSKAIEQEIQIMLFDNKETWDREEKSHFDQGNQNKFIPNGNLQRHESVLQAPPSLEKLAKEVIAYKYINACVIKTSDVKDIQDKIIGPLNREKGGNTFDAQRVSKIIDDAGNVLQRIQHQLDSDESFEQHYK
jgi:hypothetical protein